jgi:hypothetical protein
LIILRYSPTFTRDALDMTSDRFLFSRDAQNILRHDRQFSRESLDMRGDRSSFSRSPIADFLVIQPICCPAI